jgi:hypothetical protein
MVFIINIDSDVAESGELHFLDLGRFFVGGSFFEGFIFG